MHACLGMGCVGRYVPEPVYVMRQERKIVYAYMYVCSWGRVLGNVI